MLGVFADDRGQTLWVCSSAPAPARGAAPPAQPAGDTGVKSFNLSTGAPKGSFVFPGNSGTCNDMAVAADGTLYATDTPGARVLRLKPGAAAMDVWFENPIITSADGIAVLETVRSSSTSVATGGNCEDHGRDLVKPRRRPGRNLAADRAGLTACAVSAVMRCCSLKATDTSSRSPQAVARCTKTPKDLRWARRAVTLVGNQAFVLA